MRKIFKSLTALLLTFAFIVSFSIGTLAAEPTAATHNIENSVAACITPSGAVTYISIQTTNTASPYAEGNVAYCIEHLVDGTSNGTAGTLAGTASQAVRNVLYNGFPHKTAAQLGASSNREAYLATNLAIYVACGDETEAWLERKQDYNGMKCATLAKKIYAASKASPAPAIQNAPKLTITTNNEDVNIVGDYYHVGSYTIKNNGANYSGGRMELEEAPDTVEIVRNGANFYFKIPITVDLTSIDIIRATVSTSVSNFIAHTYNMPSGKQDIVLTAKAEQLTGSARVNKTFDGYLANLFIHKTDDNNKALAGAVFEVKNINTGTTYTETVKADGYIRLYNIPYGEYEVKEITAPTGFVLDSSVTRVTLDSTNDNATITINRVNKAQKGTITITKSGESFDGYDQSNAPAYSEKPLAGAEFKVEAAEDITVNGSMVYGAGELF